MEKLFRVNGKLFTDEKEALEYEKELQAKEKNKKEKLEKESALLELINKHIDALQEIVEEYEKISGYKTYFANENGKLKLKKQLSYNELFKHFDNFF